MKTKSPRHQAEQFELARTITSPFTLKDHYARLWSELLVHYAKEGYELSQAQVAKAMIQRGLDQWAKEREQGHLPKRS